MRIIRNAEEGKQLLLSRRPLETEELPMDMRETTFRAFGAELSPDEVVRRIVRDVREDGDNAVRYYNSRIDGATVGDLKVSRDEIAEAYHTLDGNLIEALKFAAERVRRYHETQLRGAMFDFQQNGLGQMTRPIQRAAIYVVMIGEDDQGAPIELAEIVSGIGSLADIDWSLAALEPALDRLHGHLQAKRHAVPARGGEQIVVLSPDLSGMLAHEAMGHPCEADAVLSGAVTADLRDRPVASELITMVDLAHHWDGQELMCPVYVDDEGTPATDVTMIERGVLRQFMHSRETAARLGLAPSGNARAYGPDDEPLVRMRNTAILPGTQTLEALIAGVEDGYLLLDTSNGQADATTEFMFGVNLGYEIRNGKLGHAIRDTTLSGSALKVLSSVDGVGSDMKWSCNGYCGKKQPMVVSVGGPSLRARAHLGGE